MVPSAPLLNESSIRSFPSPDGSSTIQNRSLSSQIAVAIKALAQAGAKPADVAAIGIANQRETAIVWNRETGKPVYNAIVWQDRRTADFCEHFAAQGHGHSSSSAPVCLIDSYFSATKISWILDNVPGARELAEAGKLAFGTVDSGWSGS